MKKYQKIIIGIVIFLVLWYIIGLLFFGDDEEKAEEILTPPVKTEESVAVTDKGTSETETGLATPVINSVRNTAAGIEVKWDTVEGAAKYRVFYRIAGGEWTAAADVAETEAVVKGLTSGTTYLIVVRCISEDGKSYTSPYDTSESKEITYIAQPALTDAANTTNGVALKWGAVEGAAQYRVFYRIGTGEWTPATDTAGTDAVVTGLTKGTTYTFTVRCLSEDGKSFTSSYDSNGKTVTIE